MALKGLPKSYIKKYGITKLAWKKYRASKSKSRGNPKRSSPRPKTRAKTKRRRTYLTRRKRHRSRSFTVPLAVVGGMVGALSSKWPHADSPIGYALQGNWQGVLRGLATNFSGINPDDGRFNMASLINTYGSLLAGILAHKFIGGAPINANRMLAAAGVPIIRI